MLLQKDGLVSMNTVAHEGKVVVIATDKDGGLWYTVKQDGFEESYLGADPTKRTGWENWAAVELPDEADDASVVEFEKASLTRKVKPFTQLMRSVYKSRDLGAAYPVQLVSAQGHLYIFRQSKGKEATLLCDRFVLDGMTNKLGRKIEVRFKRSRQRLAPYEAGPKNAMAADSLDFRDTSGNFFYEPTTELLFTKGVKNGWFTVVRAATGEHEKFRWHIVYCNSKWAEMVSIRASEDGLFDLRDETTFDPAPGDGDPPIPRSIPGILWRTLKVPGAMITGGPAATLYDLQQEREVGNGGAMQLLRTETRLMLVLPTSQGTAAYSFALAKDGSLSELGSNGTPEVLRSDQREILLPLNTLDELKLIGDTTPPPQGTIRSMRLGSGDDNADGKVVVASAEAALLSSGDTIEIQKTSNYDGLYTVSVIDDQSFVIDVDFVDNQLGVWEKVETEPEGLVFDGMVTSYEKIADGKLKVTARNHGLSNGDGVQLVGTVDCDGTFPVTRLDNSTFVIDGKWATSEAKNLRLESLKRRGLVLDGDDDHIDLPMDAFPGGKEVTICLWARGIRTADVTLLEATDKDGKRVALISFPTAAGQISFECGNGADGCDRAQKAAQPAEYTDGWAHWAFTKNAVSGELAIYRNGVLWTSSTGKFPIGAAKQLRLGASIAGTIGKNRFEGTLAELTIYGRALRAEEIRDTMFLALSGQEPGLLGYWRLGGVVEGEIRKVIDLSPNGWDGTVVGGAWAGAVTYERKLRDGKTLAVRYTNSELIAVSQRATYVEEFEFRITAAGKPLTKAALQNMERSGKPVFVMRYWGKRSRSAEETIVFNPQPKTDLFADVGDGWLRASCRLTIPDGVALLRSFEIAEVRGTWDRIEIRKHGMRLISDAITELYYEDAPPLRPLSAAGGDLETQLKAIRASELEEAQSYADKLATEEKIALLADAEYLRIELDALQKEVESLKIEVQGLDSQYQSEKSNPFNYWCRLLLSGSTSDFLCCEDSGYLISNNWGHVFEFVPQPSGYAIRPKGENRYVMPSGSNRLVISPFDTPWPWLVERSGDTCVIKDFTIGYLYLLPGTRWIVRYPVRQSWTLQRLEEVTGKVTAAFNAWDAKKKELDVAEKRIAVLKNLLDPTSQRSELEKTVTTLVSKLVVVQTSLTAASAKYLDGVKSVTIGALAMPQIAKDSRGLLTRGSMLDFVRPASRVSLLETCEGNVQLSYLDGDGRMRITYYDATSDSRNPQFEEWLTDAGRACLRQSKLGSAASIASAIKAEDTWSVEAWVATPLPTWEWTLLASATDQKNAALVVRHGVDLGLRCEGRFFSSGFRMDTLPVGWHHIAAVRKGSGKSLAVSFYVDGEEVGDPACPRFSVLSLDGIDDSVTLQPASIPQGNELTVSFWARASGQVGQSSVVLEALDAQNKCVLRISMPDDKGAISFACAEDESGLERVAWTASSPSALSDWTHWAFTKNANTGLLRIYRNGRPWVRETGKKKPLAATVKVTMGKSAGQNAAFFRGEISDLCVWNKELPSGDIQSAMGSPVATDDTALLGCFKFEGGAQPRAKDLSKRAKHGTLDGSPTILQIEPPAQVDITKVTDTVNLDPPTTVAPVAPAPPPVRAPLQALLLDGVDDRVDLPASVIPAGNAITICFWTKGGASLPRYNSMIEAVDANRARLLNIHMAWDDGTIYWDCGGSGGTYDRIQKKATATEFKGAWVHWAFIKNAATGDMQIYRDGVLWHSGTGATRPIMAPSTVMVGRTVADPLYYAGELAELSIWNKALSEQEIKDIKDRLLVGDEAGLVGYWAFAASGAVDLTANRRNGTYAGNPTFTTTGLPALRSATAPVRGPVQALIFDGIDDHVTIPAMNVDFSKGLTIEAWVYFDKFQSFGRIIDFGNGEQSDNIIFYTNVTNPNLTLGIFLGVKGPSAFTEKPNSLATGEWIHVAATIDAKGNATLVKNGVSIHSSASALPNSVNRTINRIGKTTFSDGVCFCGKMAEVKLWNRARTVAEISQTMNQQLAGTEPGLVGYWAFSASEAIDLTPNKRNGTYVGNPAVTATNVPALQPPPIAPPPTAPTAPAPATNPPVVLPPPSLPPLKIFELRVWGTALSDEEIAVNSKTLLSGNEPGLLAYLPMSEPTGPELRDQTGRGQTATIEAAVRWACSAQIGLLGKDRDGLVCAEYGSVALDPATQRKTSIMRRFFASATNGAVLVLPDKRIEELDLFWIGNAQFAPTLLGYIEGAPPIPSENLTENPSYNGATSVELVTSEDLEFRWNRSQDLGAGMSLDGFLGYEDQLLNTMSGNQKMLDVRSGLKLNFNLNKTWQSETNITTRSSNRLTDRLELRGTPEQTPKFPNIGLRYIPKNVGYALVISGTADVFIMRLSRSGKMIGYQASPIEGIPPDVNTITFLMNPAYVMQGSLDGLTGSKPTSDRFHRHVPAMRAQYGGLYPASYYRLKEAYALKQQIENDDKRRESFFAQFSTSGMAASMESQIDEAKDPEAIGVSPGGGAGADQEQQKKESEEAAGAQSDAVKKKQAEIDRMIADPGQRAQAEAGFASWQKKMERLQVLAGKRNIVNTYVWDADGGLRTEQQSFASTAEHMIGGSFSVDGALGYEGQFNVMGVKAELTAMANMSFTQTMNKTRSTSKGIELNVDLSGVESIGITNHDDEPILPGEKVDRYRFMTFYLEGSTQNFHDFWSYVVDPEWLRTNGEEARALRQAMGKANKAWRVLHRVTYVERPALRGSGRDARAEMDMAPDTAFDVVTKYLQSLTKNQLSIQAQLNDAVKILQGLRLKMGS